MKISSRLLTLFLLTTASGIVADTARADPNPLRNAYFGELHLHTTMSLDAYMGQSRNTPDDAYRFAKGEPRPVPGGTARLHAPLDFAAVTDHSEFFADSYIAQTPSEPLYNSEIAVKIRNEEKSEDVSNWVFVNVVQAATRLGTQSELGKSPDGEQARKNAWKIINEATERHYEPGVFTTLHAFEWSAAPEGANMHRNVIFRDTVVPEIAVSALDTNEQEGLWKHLQQYEKNGSTVLAIPHNSNFSADLMFRPLTVAGKPIDKDWVETRRKWEPLIEIMQIKQSSETHPSYAPKDEFADFEVPVNLTNPRNQGRHNWVREGLKDGLLLEEQFGTNPFKMGVVGGTDNHNGTPSDVEEYDWVGSHGIEDRSPKDRRDGNLANWIDTKYLNPGSITGVWARENTREEIFDALARREVFATSGTRIKVRLFAGWDFPSDLHKQIDAVAHADVSGVPMGADLAPGPQGVAPKFFIQALKDPNSAHLDRIQIVKGWLDSPNLSHEKIYDVAWSGGRKPGDNSKLPRVGNTVDVPSATYTNSIGASQLATTWTDPDFGPSQRAFYYVRVLEIPTPRWSTYDARDLGTAPPEGVPATIQERAWASPIWYTPKG